MSEFYYESPFEFIADDCDDMTALNPAFEFYPTICTMEDYYYDRLERYYRAYVGKCIRDGVVGVNRRTLKVPMPTRAEVADMAMKRLECSKIEGNGTAFNMDAVFEVHVYIYQEDEGLLNRMGAYAEGVRDMRRDKVKQWYRVRGVFDLCGPADSLCREIMIYDRKDAVRNNPLSTALVPIISRNQFDAEVTKMLKKYRMERSLRECGRVDGYVLAGNMGLTVKEARLSRDYRIRGKFYPFERDITAYLDDGREYPMHVDAGTILIDPIACMDEDGIQDAIIHECVHCEFHNLFYGLQSTYNEQLEYLACIDYRYGHYLTEDSYEQRVADEAMYEMFRKLPNGKYMPKSGHEWAEWQAVNMTPHVRMPAEQTRKKISELYREHKDLRRNGANSAEVAAAVIKDLADFYGTSTGTARIRMIDLGYHVARGAMVEVDGVTVPPFMTSNGRMAGDISYVISFANLEKLW